MQLIAIRQFTSVTAKLSAAAFLRLHDPKFSIQASIYPQWLAVSYKLISIYIASYILTISDEYNSYKIATVYQWPPLKIPMQFNDS